MNDDTPNEHTSGEDFNDIENRADADETPETDDVDGFDDADTPAVPHPVNWNLLSADDLEAEWLALNDWVAWLRRTYGLPVSVLPESTSAKLTPGIRFASSTSSRSVRPRVSDVLPTTTMFCRSAPRTSTSQDMTESCTSCGIDTRSLSEWACDPVSSMRNAEGGVTVFLSA